MKLTFSKQFKALLTATIQALSETEIITDGEPMKLSEKMITLGQALITIGHYGKDDFDSIDKEE